MEWQPPVAPGPPPPPAPEAPAPSSQQPRWALARWSERVGATILDSIFLILLIVVPVAAGAGLGAATDELAGIPFYAAAAVVWLFYAPYLMRREGERNGQTWGKQAVGIRVVKEDGQPMTFGWSFFREFLIKTVLFGWVGGSLVIGWVLDVLWPLWDDENRALHDMIVATRVVQA